MAIKHHLHEQTSLSDHHYSSSFSLDALYCEEQTCEEDNTIEEEVEEEQEHDEFGGPFVLFEKDMFFEDTELFTLYSKEHQQRLNNVRRTDSFFLMSRTQAVLWILKVNAHYGFKALTAILAIDYLDRFLCSYYLQRDNNKPWMIQLVAVTCLSLASKVEETHVPLLLDLQVEEAKYVFEAKTIQRMELLVLSSLKWKMHPVTPFSFLDYIIRRLELKSHNLHFEFLRRCECVLLSVVSDSRSINFLPSVLATATMIHVIDQLEPFNSLVYQTQLMDVLNINKEQLNNCYDLIVEVSKTEEANNLHKKSQKRKYEAVPSSPSGVIEANMFSSCDSSNDSSILGSVVASSSPEPLFKKSRA